MSATPSIVLVNLRVVSKIQPGDRLQCTDSRYFGIDRGYWTFLWRWMKTDSRALALERLDDTIDQSLKTSSSDALVRDLLHEACTGINNLIETYHTDPTTVSRLETILQRCRSPMTDVEQAL